MPQSKRARAAAATSCSVFAPADNLRSALKEGGLTPSGGGSIEPPAPGPDPRQDREAAAGPPLARLEVSSATSCSTCGAVFADRDAMREHFKLDWHRFNLKAALEGRSAVSEADFEAMLERGEGDDISLSGSDEDDDDDAEEGAEDAQAEEELRRRRHPWLFFEDGRGELMSFHRCAIDRKVGRGEEDPTDVDLLGGFKALAADPSTQWAVLLLGGGHFAGAVFRGQKPEVHKTFHCYTVRAKQGGSQSARDNKGGGSHPKSAGASLRRYNEASFAQHVVDILSTWAPNLEKCRRIFYRATGGNKALLFGGKQPPLDRGDDRLRSVPFATKRATFREVKRVHEVLSAVQFHGEARVYWEEREGEGGENEQRAKRLPEGKKRSPTKRAGIRRSKSREEVVRELPEEIKHLISSPSEEEESDDELRLSSFVSSTSHLIEFENTPVPRRGRGQKTANNAGQDSEAPNVITSNLLTACKSNNAKALSNLLEELECDMDSDAMTSVLNQPLGSSRRTFLHLATADSNRDVVRLLLRKGADPCLRDKSKKVPYQLCADKDMRNVYRAFRGEFPSAHDYTTAMVPEPASEEAEARQREKKARQRQARREKAKAAKEEQAVKDREEAERQRYLKLSDREKRALAAERRIVAARQDGEDDQEKPQAGAVLSRCFECAVDITGKVPFEYSNFVFCSPRCVREHRQKGKTTS